MRFLKLLREYTNEQGLEVIREFVDVETAKRAGRRAFSEMVDFLKRRRKTCRVLLVEKTDRLYRNLRDYVTLDELDLEVHFVKESFILSDESRSTEKFMHGMKVLMAKQYVENLGEEASKGMREKAEQGTWPSYAPIGYVNVNVGDKRSIALDPERAGLMKSMFEMYAQGNCSLAEVQTWAAGEGLTTRRGGPPSKSTIQRILMNPFYMGVFEWNGRTHKGDHPPLVSADLFTRTQAAFRSGNHPVEEKRRSFAYTGLIKCAHCGCSITAGVHKGHYVYYRCTGARGGCKPRLIREDRLEELLAELVRRVHIDEETIEWIVEALKASHADKKEYHEEQLARIEGELKRLRGRMDAVYEDKLDGKIGEDFWERKRREYRAREAELMRALEQHQKANTFYFDAGVRVLRLAEKAYELWLAQPQTEKRRLLDTLLLNCTFDGENLDATYRKPFCWLAEGPVRSIWRAVRDDFANWFQAEECLEVAHLDG